MLKTRSLLFIFVFLFLFSFTQAILDIKTFDATVPDNGEIKVSEWLGISKKADYRLTDYGGSVINIYAEGEYNLHKKTHLFTGVFYKDLKNQMGELRDTQFYIWEDKSETRYNPIYENYNCRLDDSDNEYKIEKCDTRLLSNESYMVDVSGWIPYEKGMDLEISEGRWRMEAKRVANKRIDFILEGHGKAFTEWAWINDSWEYRRPIEIEEKSNVSNTNYSVLIYIPYDSDMQSDFDDIRFTNSDETTELDYWIKNKTDSNFTWVWVKLPSITALTNNTIYLYYGNSVVSTSSNFNNAFLFADDFNDNTLSARWSKVSGAGSLNESDNKLNIVNEVRLNITGLNILNTEINYNVNITGGANQAIYGKIRTSGATLSTSYEQELIYTADGSRLIRNEANVLVNPGFKPDLNTVYNMSIKALNIGSDVNINTTKNGVSFTNYKDTTSPVGNGSAGFRTSAVSTINIDNFYLRPIVATEPIYYIGDEQTNAGVTVDFVTPPTSVNGYNSTTQKNITIQLNATFTETAFENMTFYIFNSTGLYFSESRTTENYTLNKNDMENGTYTYYGQVCANDGSCSVTENRTINYIFSVAVDYVTPTPTNGTINYTSKELNIKVSPTYNGTSYKNVTYNIYNTTGLYFSGTNTSADYTFLKSDMTNGTYVYNVQVCSIENICASTTNRTITYMFSVAVDFVTPPTPVNNTNTTSPSLTIQLIPTYNGTVFKNATYNIYNTTGLYFSGTNTSANYTFQKSNMVSGNYTYNATLCTQEDICASTDTRYINYDVSINIDYVSPTRADNASTNAITFPINVTVEFGELSYVNITYKLYSSTYTLLESLTFTNDTYYIDFGNKAEGTYYYNVTTCAEDGMLNPYCVSTPTRTVHFDRTAPVISAGFEDNLVYVPNGNLTINYNITDATLDKCWYNYDGVNTSLTCGTGLDVTFEIESDEQQIIIYANDSVGVLTSYTLVFNISTIPPTINITSPLTTYGYLYDGQIIDFNYSIATDGELDTCWYEYNNISSFYRIIDNISIELRTNGVGASQSIIRYNLVNGTSYNSSLIETVSSSYVKLYYDKIPTTLINSIDLYLGGTLGGSVGYSQNFLIKYNDGSEYSNTTEYTSSGYPTPYKVTFTPPVNSINCSTNTTFNYISGVNNITLYANDSLGNLASETRSWELFFESFDLTYDPIDYEGSLSTFTADITLNGTERITQAIFNYGGVNYSTTILYSSGNYQVGASIPLPTVTNDTNYTFSFLVEIDGTFYSPREDIQIVLNIEFSNCSTGDELVNLFLVDERLQTAIVGDIQLNAQITNKYSDTVIDSINLLFENVSEGNICLSPSESYDNYYFYLEARYVATDYVPELYYIQKADLTDYPKNVTLYDLASSESTEFLIKYQDDNLISVSEAVIQLQRKYIDEDSYKVVEAPLTSATGTAVVHIDLNTNKYRAVVVKDGVVLDVFDNLVFKCDNELSGQCYQDLLGEINPQNSVSVEIIEDFTYVVSSVNNTLTTTFSIPSGSPSSVNIVMKQKDVYGEEFLCNETVTSSGGSIDCSYSETLGDSYITLEVLKDGDLIGSKSYMIEDTADLGFLGNNYFIVAIFILSLVGMAFSSPEFMIINSVIVLLFAGAIWLVNGLNFVVGIGSLVWLVIGSGILIYKISQQEDR